MDTIPEFVAGGDPLDPHQRLTETIMWLTRLRRELDAGMPEDSAKGWVDKILDIAKGTDA